MVLVAEKDYPSAHQSAPGDLRSTMGRYRSLANIGRVLWECQRNGSRLDGAVEDLRLIREPTSGEIDWPELITPTKRVSREATHVWSPGKCRFPLSESLRT